MKNILTLILCLIATYGQAQYFGKVLDADNKQPLAFVTVYNTETKKYAQTDINGAFKIDLPATSTTVQLSYIGYETKKAILYNGLNNLYLKESSTAVAEVSIIAGENPANALIRRVITNADKNNPEKYTSFRYKAYNKFVINSKNTPTEDSAFYKSLEKLPDSIKVRQIKVKKAADSFSAKKDFFITETLTERQFLFPDLSKETVVASRMSGFKNPQFSLISSQLQSFSVYNTFLKLDDKEYLSPISNNSYEKYFFNIVDTTFSEADTIFIVSFRPKRNTNFEALSGSIYINSDGYAVQNLIAEPANKKASYIKIQQLYKRTNGFWFPEQLNTNIYFDNVSIEGVFLRGVGQSYIKELEIGLKIPSRNFNELTLDYAPDATKNAEEKIRPYRNDTTVNRDKNTYQFIDSVGKDGKIERTVNALLILNNGYIPFKILNFGLDKFINANDFEGLRLGAGAETNKKLSKYFSLNGYGAYGFKDKAWKYGYGATIKLYNPLELRAYASYAKDVAESGNMPFSFYKNTNASVGYRNLFVNNMDKLEQQQVGIKARLFSYWQVDVYKSINDYRFTSSYLFSDARATGFKSDALGVNLRFAFREKYGLQMGQKLNLGTKYPIFYTNFVRHTIQNSANEPITIIQSLLTYKFSFRSIGSSNFAIKAGRTWGAAPYSLQNTAPANFHKGLQLAGGQAFETMRFNEFLSDRYVYFFYKHSFKTLLFKTKNFAPQLSLAYNAGIGDIKNTVSHANYTYKALNQTYQEAGLIIDDILNLGNTLKQGFGVAVYYKLGAYSSANYKDNAVVKLSYRIGL